jgi:tRNA(Arg) A34 adenosine deaminase TadA
MVALTIVLPDWIDDIAEQFVGETDEQRMELCVALSQRNIERDGGPFAALVFSGSELIGAGVNRVLASGFSIAHAEILALMSAQQRIASTGLAPRQPYSLVTSTEPCCQCFGALIWSGVTRLVCGATTADAEAVGFDEGPKPDDWTKVLEARGISVTHSVLRAKAKQVLDEYERRGGAIYGLRHPAAP